MLDHIHLEVETAVSATVHKDQVVVEIVESNMGIGMGEDLCMRDKSSGSVVEEAMRVADIAQ
jgi:hypothetical protein